MPLAPGSRIGPYEVTGALGAGGMGEVYRARDARLNRDVAVKVLPDLLAADAERLARFTREAQTLASLNHPNIAGIYGIEERAIIMELVEGDDLSDRISRGAMPVDEALAIARQIIEALEAAHDLGIVHRDLKPANIKIRHDGTVKVLDFGLAKALNADHAGSSADAAASPTLTARATQAGVIIGTAAYMSPEQARGRAVDKRTDVWAFGCVLFEMLSGTKAFQGEDATEIIAAVVKTEPAWQALPATLPSNVRTVVMRCLAKDRKARLPDLSVVRYLLDGTIPSADPPRRSSRVWQAAAAVLALTSVAAGAGWYRATVATTPVTRFELSPPENMTFTAGVRANAAAPAISPDGRTVAFTAQDAMGKRMLWVRPIDSLTAQALPGTEGAANPFWSPDSSVIGYGISGRLMKVAPNGGPVTTLCVISPGITSRGGTWSRDGVIVFNNGPAPLYRVSSSGGDPVAIGELSDGETGREFPAFLPDGRHFLYHTAGSTERGGVFVGSLDSNVTRRILSANSGAIFDQTSGHLLFVRQGTLFAQRFDPKTFGLTGDAFPVAERVEFNAVPGSVAFSVSDTGVLAYGTGDASGSGYQLTWVDRTGKVTGTVGPEANYRGVDLSPDGSRIAAHRHDDEGGDIWVTDVSRNTTSRLTFDATRENAAPAWSPDGTRVAYASTRDSKNGISMKSADNTKEEERLFDTADRRGLAPSGWSADGRSVLFSMLGPRTANDLWWLPLSDPRRPIPVLESESSESAGQVSPDGKWLAYASSETGGNDIYVQPVSTTGGKWAVSNGGGGAPRWRGDSKELFFLSRSKVFAVEVATEGAAFVAGVPKPLFDYIGTGSLGHGLHFSYAVSKDGQRFLISAPAPGRSVSQSPIVVVVNWLDAIRK
jgi:Tol biopolymer transport system component/predicted Ser/Thr protein kinase